MEMTKGEKIGVAAGLVFVAVILFFVFCFRTVGAGQVGIITRFGEVNRVAKSGVALKLPWPIEHIEKMETRVQKDQETASAATSDQQDVNTTLALNYALDNDTALEVYKTLGSDYKDRVITPAVQESFKAASSKFTALQLTTKRTEVKEEALKVIKERLGKYGIRVVDLSVINLAFSAEYNKAIESVQIANQQVAKAKQQLEKTKVDAERAIAEAKGAAEAQRLQQQTLTKEMLQKMAIEKWDGHMPKTMAGGNSIFSIPTGK